MRVYSELETSVRLGSCLATGGNAYGMTHYQGWTDPRLSFERFFRDSLRSLAKYADDHEREYSSPLGDDSVLGDYWLQALSGVLRLLDGQTGRLDPGLILNSAYAMFKAAGFTHADLHRDAYLPIGPGTPDEPCEQCGTKAKVGA